MSEPTITLHYGQYGEPPVTITRHDQEIIQRRANAWYVFIGQRWMLRPATDRQLREALSRMVKVRHVNRALVEDELQRRDPATPVSKYPFGKWPLTVIELMFLEHAPLGVSLQRYCASHAVVRTYARDHKAEYNPAEVI